jgi:hypothetical protein
MKTDKKNMAAGFGGAADALAGKPPATDKPAKKKLKVEEIRLRRGHAGGYIAKHHLSDEDGNQHPQQHEYPMLALKDVVSHLEKHMPEDSQADGYKE